MILYIYWVIYMIKWKIEIFIRKLKQSVSVMFISNDKYVDNNDIEEALAPII